MPYFAVGCVLTASPDERLSFLLCDFSGSLRFRRKLKYRCLLSRTHQRKEHDLAVRKFQSVVMSGDFSFVDLPKNRGPVFNPLASPCEQVVRRTANFAGKRQLGSRQHANRDFIIVCCSKSSCASAEVARDEFVAHSRQP